MSEIEFMVGDAAKLPLADKSVDLVFGSPPYEAQRTYSIGFNLKGQAWVDWMVAVFRESLRVSRGLVAFVVEGFTEESQWSATPALLIADLHRAGVVLRKPPAFHRVGIPGGGGNSAQHSANGGGSDWLRNDYEFIICATAGRGKLPWADGSACGHEPKWNPGGAMTHHMTNGRKVAKMHTKRTATGTVTQGYGVPKKANPGNVLHYVVGGGRMGHPMAHDNEAAFPLGLAEFFVRSFCPPGGWCLDNFSGSGTTMHACELHARNGFGIDIRQEMVDLGRRRLDDVRSQRRAGQNSAADAAK